ncbi:MAG: hypothetical protein E6923_14255 [Clostridium sp.]|uniref:hypothetical protein n=1 Tax=Clostridium sp. TaxID=1506 RepID=UPI002904643E|nr:hypothetical protein [Clostridium sp.]MDU1311461.1 hypothetical protein [Clostridium sp.]MDU1409020.1 hypothetical protein [Clostridium sp.]
MKNKEGENNFENRIKNIMKLLFEYSFIFTSIVYIIGYLYTSGVNIGFYKDDVLAIYNFNSLNIINNKYFIVGIRYLLVEGFLVLISIIVAHILFNMLLNSKNRTRKFLLKLHNNDLINIILITIAYVVIYLLLKVILELKTLNIVKCIFYSVVVLFVKYQKRRGFKINIKNLLFNTFYLIMIGILVIFSGAKYTLNIIDEYNNGKKDLYVAKLYIKNEINTYLKIDDQGEEFIGYNINTGNIDNIGKGNIDNIEYLTIKPKKNVEKLDISNLSQEESKIVCLLDGYYKANRNDFDIKWNSENFSKNYYKEVYRNLKIETIEQMNNSVSSEFKSVEYSKPSFQVDTNSYKVSAIECYSNELKFTDFYIIEEEKKFKIDKVIASNDNYFFNEY